ncbi:RecG-like helicase [Microlunatus parietis]|uniref:RecG-like helicase n=2 Tax=Microlunatus parietis TaxID=682979 RepID=A0A7Y9LGS6_9ACTN|nr:RecG-like helicase [Microlunatus parietis]
MIMGKAGELFSRVLQRLTSSNEDLESAELQKNVRDSGARPIKQCKDREVVDLAGTIAAVTINPRGGHPALEAELRDGSGAVTLVWLGRRQIAGIDAGRSVRVSGRISCGGEGRIMYNPRYELIQSTHAG